MKTIANILSLLIALVLVSANLMANESTQIIGVQANESQVHLAQSLIKTYNENADNKTTLMLSTEINAQADVMIVDNYYLATNSVAWQAIMGRNAIVPVVSKKNPSFDKLISTGIAVEQMKSLFDGTTATPIIILTDEALAVLKRFTSTENTKSNVVTVNTHEAFLAQLAKNPTAVGFTLFSNLVTDNTYSYTDQLGIVPIDRNNNGRIDPMESFYETPATFSRALWMGKYPQALTANIYLAGKSIPESEDVKGAISQLLAMSQSVMGDFGYAKLESHELKTGVSNAISGIQSIETAEKNAGNNWVIVVVLFVLLLTVAGLIITYLFGTKADDTKDEEFVLRERGLFTASAVSAPAGLFYDKTHTWAFMENDGNVKVGIDDFLRNVLGKVNQVALKPVGTTVTKGETLAIVVREGKKISIKAPVSGVIIDRNNSLNSFDQEEELVKDWLYSIEPSNWKREIELMLMADTYRNWIQDEFIRLKDFLARSLQQHAPQFMPVVLQDGGELIEGFMSEMGPEIWEDFQTNFLDNAIFTKH